MLRKIGLTAAAVGIGLGGIAALATPAGAAKPALGNATGNVTCQITAKVKISPPLSNSEVAPNTTPSTTNAKVKSTSCTSSGGTIAGHLSGGKAKGTVTSTGTEPGTCTGLVGPGETPFTSVTKWKGSATLNDTSITFPNLEGELSGFDLPAGGEANKGDVTISGSFANQDAWARANIAPPDVSRCFDTPPKKPGKPAKKAKGLKKITVTSGSINITL
jgi:hypothetical protein